MPELLEVVRDAAHEKKADDVVTLEVGTRTIVADWFVVATGRSKIQTRAIADGIAEALESAGRGKPRMEGYSDGGWILIDAGPVVAHVFTPEQRSFYNLERLWGAAETRRAQES